jgi:hypothetical protein
VQTGGVMQGANTIPRRSRPSALLAGVAVLAIAALVALMFWVGPLGFGGVQTKDAVPATGAGTAVVHDDAGNLHTGLAPGYAAVHDDAGNVHPATGTAIVHDDAGNMPPPAGTAIVHDDAGNVNR